MSRKLLIFIWITCQIQLMLCDFNGIESCIYSNSTVTFVCSNNSTDNPEFFSKNDFPDCKKEFAGQAFERSAVQTINFRDCKRKNLPSGLNDVYTGIKTLSISKMSLKQLNVTNLKHLTNLVASNNKISTIPQAINSMKKIDLSNNSINSIDCNTFENAQNLKDLNLSFNNIKIVCKNLSIPATSEFLNLTHNQIDAVPVELIDNAGKLREIDLSHNEIKKINQLNVTQGNRLETIHLNHNKISSLSENAFDQCVNLKRLYLSNNDIETISPNIFNELQHLIELDISSNVLVKVINDQMFSKNLKLRKLNLANISLTILDKMLFENTPKLTHLDVSHNKITKLSDDLFRKLLKLEYLNLSSNSLEMVTKSTFMGLEHLKCVDLSFTYLTKIPVQTFASQVGLIELNLSGSNIPVLDVNIFPTKMEHFQRLTITNCRMKELKGIEGFSTKSFPKLKIVGLNDNLFDSTVVRKLVAEFSLKDNETCSCSEYWSNETITIWCLIACNIILVLILIGGIIFYKLRQRRIVPGFNLNHDYRQTYSKNKRTATIKNRHRPPKTTIIENNYELPDQYDHLKF